MLLHPAVFHPSFAKFATNSGAQASAQLVKESDESLQFFAGEFPYTRSHFDTLFVLGEMQILDW
jgi:hypothetical protein